MILTSPIREAKLVMLGSTTVGKSSIVTRLTRDTFNPDSPSTIGAAFVSKSVQVGDTQMKLQIWDTGGSERYRAMTPMYFQNADAAIIVYDITSSESFKDVDLWLKDLRDKGPPSIIIALAGNKCDLPNRDVPTDKARDHAAKNQIQLFEETSALNGKNILELFTKVAELILNGPPKDVPNSVKVQPNQENEQKSSSKCCK